MWTYRLASVITFVFTWFSLCSAEPLTLAASLLIGSAITGGSALAGSSIGAWFNYAGMKRQEAENKRAEALGIQREDAAIARSEKWAGKQWAANEETRHRNYATETRGKLLQMLASNTQMANNMISIWRGRRAA